MRRHWGLLLALALMTAGCIGTASAGSSAMAPAEGADEAARDWNEGAELVGVLGFEISEAELAEDEASANGTREEPIERATRESDQELGDGQAPVWVFIYEAGNQSYHVAVDAGGEVLAEETGPAGGQTPIEGWNVDSDEAAGIVAENNDTWAQEAEDASAIFYALNQNGTEEDPLWVLGAFLGDRPPAFFMVNATTGEYLGSHTLTMPGFSVGFGSGFRGGFGGGGVPTEEGSFEGTVSLVEPTAEHTFEVDLDDHPELQVEFELESPPTSTLTATLEGPSGTLGTLEASPTATNVEESWDAPEPGTYTVTIELDQGAAQDYTFCWRATGTGFGVGDYTPERGSSSWCGE